MIALLSAQIEAGARAFATVLVSLLPFLPDSLVTNPEQIMIVVGFAGQGLFGMRLILQWLSSETQAKSVIPIVLCISPSVVARCCFSMPSGDRIR